jgi:cytochrome b6-f complex iron-sulfur subunit
MERKDFLLSACALCGVTSVLIFLDSCSKTNLNPVNFTIDLSLPANAALNTVGGYLIQNNVIVRNTSSGFTALSLICTHQGCTVNYSGSTFYCPCHGGTYDTNGHVTGGPPPSALQQYTVTKNGTVLTIKG